ncbi:glycoside hydrolase family 3 N-terminal domain-containing protein [Bacteroidota bacterium]
MKFKLIIFALTFHCIFLQAQNTNPLSQYEKRIDSLLALMTLDEKLGQLFITGHGGHLTGPHGEEIDLETAIRQGKIGGLHNRRGVELLMKLQKIAVEESRLGIPLIFPADIIHGTEVVFPIPLAESSSWNLETIEQVSRIAAIEATAQGINMNYAPMADVSRDPRWGRVMEGAGEDSYLASLITGARVRGYQGKDLNDPQTMVACVKHFAAYGAVEGGRDYNVADVSERKLREYYLPSYKAGIEAGAASVMVSFNEINGMPSSCNKFLLQDILRDEWNFKGFVIGDYSSVGELVNHGIANDLKHAAELSINAGLDVDMASQAFLKHMHELIEEGKVTMETLDKSVRRMLRIKFALGIMDNPYKYLDFEREKSEVYKPEYIEIARNIAKESIVLLKNQDNILPIKKDINKIALIGPFIDNNIDPRGGWAFGGKHYDDIVSILDGIKQKGSDKTELLYAKGCNINDDTVQYFAEAIKIANSADIVVIGLGEPVNMVGEARSRTNLDLPGMQLELLKELQKTGKPIVAIILSGRPLMLEWLDNNIPAIVQAWHLGHESGNAIADVIFGDYNPSGKLTISFPYSVGQIPVYYNFKTTGRPYQENYRWSTHYIDNPNTALYPFGYGLSYTNFEYSDIILDNNILSKNENITATVTIKNSGPYDGTEIVQLYIQDIKGSVTRPVKELKGFQKIYLKSGEQQKVSFAISEDDLKFYNMDMDYVTENGEFNIFIGTNSRNTQVTSFILE